MKKTLALIVAALAVVTTPTIHAGETGHAGHNHAGHNHAKGTCTTKTLTVKDVCTIDVAHDEKAGTITLTVKGADKKALKPTKAPRLNLMVDGKRKQVKTKADDSVKAGNVFKAEGDALKGKLTGHIAIKVDGKNHKAELNPHTCESGHDHSGHSH